MPDRLKTALSALVHTFIALIVSVLVARGIDIPSTWSAVAETAILAVAVGAYAALTHWLASRTGSSFWAQAARLIAKVLTLGTGALIPADPTVPIKPAPAHAAPEAPAATPPAA